ncbi:hypothetical protein [Acidithiobacillus sp.]|uniref:hypothetical protein n=1 Tax=Acidithiobacillus sp. TaxID=1872118 RepID=UPI003CFC1C40
MRLSPEQIAQLRQSVAESFGPEIRTSFFGSQVDDHKRGGDADLLVESNAPIDNPAFSAAQLYAPPEAENGRAESRCFSHLPQPAPPVHPWYRPGRRNNAMNNAMNILAVLRADGQKARQLLGWSWRLEELATIVEHT